VLFRSAYQRLGEALKDAKKAVIEETGDARAPGFLAWAHVNLGISSTTVARMIKAYDTGETDPKRIWGHKKRLEAPPKEIVIASDNEKLADTPVKYIAVVETRNYKVMRFFNRLEKMPGTKADIRKEGVSLRICSNPGCNNELPERNKSGLCKDCYVKKLAAKKAKIKKGKGNEKEVAVG